MTILEKQHRMRSGWLIATLALCPISCAAPSKTVDIRTIYANTAAENDADRASWADRYKSSMERQDRAGEVWAEKEIKRYREDMNKYGRSNVLMCDDAASNYRDVGKRLMIYHDCLEVRASEQRQRRLEASPPKPKEQNLLKQL